MNNIYYVYKYLRSKNSKYGEVGSPYYIGKGKGKRAWSKVHRAKPPTDKSNIAIISDNMLEIDAFAEEIRLIKFYGRIDLGTGCLRNRTDGGDGSSGKITSAETKAKISTAHKNNPMSKEHKYKLLIANKGKPGHNLGRKLSEEWKANISASRKGVKHGPMSEETKAKLSVAHKGKKISPEVIAKVAASNRGKKHTPCSDETKAKISAAKKGKHIGPRGPMKEETKAKLSAANKGRKMPPASEESKAKNSIAHKGKKHSEETRARMSTARKGKNCKPCREETKAKMSAAQKIRWSKVKELNKQ